MSRPNAYGLPALWALWGLLIAAGSVDAATMYRWVDAQGVVHYSDAPQPGATAMAVHPAQTYHAPPAPRAAQTQPATPTPNGEQSALYQCRITAPVAEQTFANPEVVSIDVSVLPGLRDGDQLLVGVDGVMLPASPGTQVQFPQPERGAHTISAVVRSVDGTDACVAAPVTFNVQRTSRLSPQSPTRGR